MKRFLILTSVSIALTCSPLRANEQSDAAAKEALVSALKKMSQNEELVFRGSVSKKAKQVGPTTSDGMTVMVVQKVAGSDPATWHGDLEVWQNAKGETVITSQKQLPGFGILDDGSRALTSMTFEEKPFSLSQLGGELPQLLNWERLGTIVENAEKIQQETKDGSTVFSCELSKRLIRVSSTGIGAIMAPKILRIEGTFTLNKQGNLAALEFQVVRNDPLAEMLRGGALSGAEIKVDGGKIPEGEVGDQIRKAIDDTLKPKAGENEPGAPQGKTTIYRLERTNKVSSRAQRFAAHMRKLVDGQ
jgi:hypothetical protein